LSENYPSQEYFPIKYNTTEVPQSFSKEPQLYERTPSCKSDTSGMKVKIEGTFKNTESVRVPCSSGDEPSQEAWIRCYRPERDIGLSETELREDFPIFLTASLREEDYPEIIFPEWLSRIRNKRISERKEFMRGIERKIKEASHHLDKLRGREEYYDISEDNWNYSMNTLRKIRGEFWNQFHTKFPIPRFNFIDDSIEIKWEKDKRVLIISTSNDLDGFLVYKENKKGHSKYGNVSEKRIVEWVISWLKKVLIQKKF